MDFDTVPASGAEPTVTVVHEFDLALDDGETIVAYGSMSIEYRPRAFELAPGEIESLREWLQPSFDDPAEAVEAAYRALVDALYPGYESRDEPWEYTPMLISYSYEHPNQPTRNDYASLGSLR